MACSRQDGHRQSLPSSPSGMMLGSFAHQQLLAGPLAPQLKLSPQRWHCLASTCGGKASKRFHTAFFSKSLKPGQPAISLMERRQLRQCSPVASSWQRCWHGDGMGGFMPHTYWRGNHQPIREVAAVATKVAHYGPARRLTKWKCYTYDAYTTCYKGNSTNPARGTRYQKSYGMITRQLNDMEIQAFHLSVRK